MSDFDFVSMSSNRKNVNRLIFKKNVRFQHFCLKMWALEKWCVTKVAHCIYNIIYKIGSNKKRANQPAQMRGSFAPLLSANTKTELLIRPVYIQCAKTLKMKV